jgi:hypothetical protein
MTTIMINKLTPYFTPLGIDVSKVPFHDGFAGSIYVGQFPHAGKDRHGELHFLDYAVDVFYQPNPKTELGHSHYFSVYTRPGHSYVSDASYVTDLRLGGVIDSVGNILYARFQHDFRYTHDSNAGVDGGWWMKDEDNGSWSMWGRTIGGKDGTFPKMVPLRVVDGKLVQDET